jgi:acyl-CoA thioester hydrolase
MTKGTHSFPIRIYYEDTDAGGIVYYANYLKFAERARTEALRLSGFDQSELMENQQVGFVVRRCVVDYLRPAMLDDLLTIETQLHDISKVSMELQQTIRRGKEILVTIEVKLAVVGPDKKLAKLPDTVRKAMLKLFNH